MYQVQKVEEGDRVGKNGRWEQGAATEGVTWMLACLRRTPPPRTLAPGRLSGAVRLLLINAAE